MNLIGGKMAELNQKSTKPQVSISLPQASCVLKKISSARVGQYVL